MTWTINGIQYAERPHTRETARFRRLRLDLICEAHGIQHRLTLPNHPWKNGRITRMNRTIKDATDKRKHHAGPKKSALSPQRRVRHLQLRPSSQDSEQPETLRSRPGNLDIRARSFHPKSDPADAGSDQRIQPTELGGRCTRRRRSTCRWRRDRCATDVGRRACRRARPGRRR